MSLNLGCVGKVEDTCALCRDSTSLALLVVAAREVLTIQVPGGSMFTSKVPAAGALEVDYPPRSINYAA